MARVLVLALAAIALAGCGGGGSPSPESIVRAWSKAVNAGHDDQAADLFAPEARAVQGDRVLVLRTHRDAVNWNEGLPCSGTIESIKRRGDLVTATFLLGERPHHLCDGPGAEATAVFRIRDGKIVLWHQIGPQPAPEPV